MSLILHLSDTHFGAERVEVVEALLRLAQTQRPDLAILSGDVTQRARREEFAAARHFVDRLAASAGRTLVLPGNHDIPLFAVWRRLFAPYGGYCRVFGPELEPSFEDARLLVVGVRTTRRYRHIDGTVSARQVARVGERLRRSAAALKLVVTHQPVHVERREDAHNLLHGRAAALRQWSAAGADLILGGHIHLPFAAPLQAAHGLPREVWAVQAGTAVSRRTRPGIANSVNLIRHDAGAGRCAIERWDYDASTQAFARGAVTDAGLSR
jgi:3',5'-cyclic AMP phosphodiesterase CpdA